MKKEEGRMKKPEYLFPSRLKILHSSFFLLHFL